MLPVAACKLLDATVMDEKARWLVICAAIENARGLTCNLHPENSGISMASRNA